MHFGVSFYFVVSHPNRGERTFRALHTHTIMPPLPLRPFILWIAVLFLFVAENGAQGQTTAYTLDEAGMTDSTELYLAGVLQGIVNRDAPRLFLTRTPANGWSGGDHMLAQYLAAQKGFTFVKLRTLNDAIAFFATQKRADGTTPLIKGLVNYQPSYWNGIQTVDKYYNYWIAANFAAQEDLLPVTASILSNSTPLLSGMDFWYKDMQMSGWGANFITGSSGASGLAMTTGTDPSRCARFGEYFVKWIDLDLSVTPKVEVVISAISSGGSWSLGIDMGSTVDAADNLDSTHVPALTNVTTSGTFTVDLSASGLFNPTAGRAGLRFCVMTPSTTVTVKSIRFLDASGNDPSAALYSPPKTEFSSLSVTRDLTNATQYPQLATQEEAIAWSIANQFPLCAKDELGGTSGQAWSSSCIDHMIARKTYMYYDGLTPFADLTPNLDYLLSQLSPGARVATWVGDSEDYMVEKYGEYGARVMIPFENASFWKWIPTTGVQLPQVRSVASAQNLFYVNFSEASGDAFNPMETGYWQDPVRGTMPLTWGLNPCYAEFAPALIEYFANTATPDDSFWAGPSGAGYTHPSSMLPAALTTYATLTRQDIQSLGICPVMDFWDIGNASSTRTAFTTGTGPAPIRTIIPLAIASGENHWMEDGTPFVIPATGICDLYDGDGVSTPASVAAAIQAVAAAHPEAGPSNGPFFITCNIRFTPTFYKAVRDLLPADQFLLVAMPDFIGLAQEASGFAVVPYANGVGSGDTLNVSLELHNAVGATGSAGSITWTLPPGWSSSPTNWVHGTVATGTNLKQVVTFTPPAGMTTGTTSIKFSDSRVGWNRTLLVNTYPQGATVTNCTDTSGWTASGSASVSMDNGMVKVLPMQGVRRPDFIEGLSGANGRVSLPLGRVDFTRQPYLEVNIPDQDSNQTKIGVSNSSTNKQLLSTSLNKSNVLDLAALTAWTGVQNLTLTLDPVTNYGTYLRVQAVKVHYGVAQPAAVVVNSGTVNLAANKYAVINAGTLYCSSSSGSTFLNTLNMGGSGTLSLDANFTLPLYQLSGSGTLTITGSGNWNYGVNLEVDANPLFTGKIVVSNAWLWATDASLGAVPAAPVPDAITLNNGNLSVSGTISANRGITLGTGAEMIYGSVATLNNKITGSNGLLVRAGSLVLNNNTNDFTGDFSTYSNTTTIGIDNALPHGPGKGTLRFTDWNGGNTGSTIDLNGHTLTVNALTQSAIATNSNIDNKAAGAATLVIGDANASGTFGGVIMNTGGPLSLTKIGAGKQTLTNICTYTGATLVSGGTLALTGSASIANSSSITVAAGAVLDATGRSDGTFTLASGQTLTLNGVIKGLAQSGGGFSPGSGNLILSNSAYLPSAAGSLNLTLTGPNTCGSLSVSSSASLNGALTVTAGGYSPQLGDRFTLLTAASVSGSFSSVTLPALAQGLNWNLTYGAASVQLSVTGLQWDPTPGVTGAQGGSGTWNLSGSNWIDGTGTNVSWPNDGRSSIAAFDSATVSGTSTVTVSGSVNAAGFLFSSATTPYLLTGGTIAMSGSALPIVVNGAPVIIDSVISGSGSIVKSGSGKLTLTGSSPYTGAVLINSGTLALTGSGSLANGSGITIDGGAVLDASGRSDGLLPLGPGQTLIVNGQLFGGVQSNGPLAPGPGVLTLGGNYTQLASSSLSVTITASGSCGALVLTGSASLSGALSVTATGYVPQAGDQFTVLSAASVSGTFASLSLPSLPLGLMWKAVYGATSVKLAVVGQFWNIGGGTTGAQGGSGTWDLTHTNWFDGSSANGTWPNANPNSMAVFGSMSSLGLATVTVSGSVSSGGLFFTSGSNPYTLTGGTICASGSSLVVTANGSQVTIASALSGTGSLIKSGPGPVTLTGSNTYSGGTTVTGGTLTLSSALRGGITLNGGCIAYGGTAMAVTPVVVGTAGGTLSVASGNLTLSGLSGSGSVNFRSSAPAWQRGTTLSGTNSGFTGVVACSYGWLFAAADASFGAVPSNYTANAITLGSGATLSAVSGTLTIPANRGITLLSGANPMTYGNIILGSRITGASFFQSRGVQVLASGSNDYTGGTYLWATTLIVGASNAIPHGAGMGGVVFQDWDGNSTLDLAGWSPTINALSSPVSPVHTEAVDNTQAAPVTFTVGDCNATGTFGGIIRNTGGALSLTKIGTGSQMLANISTYTGATLVSSGTLALTGSGSISNSAGITVASNAVLDVSARSDATLTVTGSQALLGSGSIAGAVVLNGTFSPGNGSAYPAISGSYRQSASGVLDLKLVAAGACDAVAIGGAASLGGTLRVTIPNGYIPHSGEQFTLLMAGSVSGVFATSSLPALTPGLSWAVNYGASSVQLSVSGRPAPATYAAYAAYYGIGAGNVDPDRTGLTNLMRYATGRVPGGTPTVAPAQVSATGSGLTFAFNRNTDTTSLNYFVETAPTPAGPWTAIASKVQAGAWTGSASVSETASGPGVSQITVSAIDKSGQVGFIHLRVEGL